MNLLLKRRVKTATDNARNILTSYCHTNAIGKELKEARARAVRNRIDDKYIVRQSSGIVVTEIGYVTMALLPGYSIYKKGLLLIPGVDEKSRFGYLVLRGKYMPFHSLAQNIDDAVAETQAAHRRATELLNYYGNIKSLKKAARSAPWYQLSTIEDAVDAGMCEWGTMNFLERTKISSIARYFGLPRCLVGFAGGFGNRVIASTSRRLEEKLTTKTCTAISTEEQKRKHA
ncbi:MAG: hypothetical protein V3U65_18290 [Granulosicoccaceae bacterium]